MRPDSKRIPKGFHPKAQDSRQATLGNKPNSENYPEGVVDRLWNPFRVPFFVGAEPRVASWQPWALECKPVGLVGISHGFSLGDCRSATGPVAREAKRRSSERAARAPVGALSRNDPNCEKFGLGNTRHALSRGTVVAEFAKNLAAWHSESGKTAKFLANSATLGIHVFPKGQPSD